MKKNRLRAAPALVGVIASVVTLAAGPALGAAAISKCATISKPGSYTLTRNLTAVGDCLVVAADFVALNLDGWVISGNGSTGRGITDRGNSRRGIAVRSGTVTGFEIAVGLGATSGAVVEKVQAIDNAAAGISAGLGSTVSGNIVRNTPFSIQAGRGSIISGNAVQGGGEIDIGAGPNSIISGNTLLASGSGISSGDGSIVSGNTVSGGDGSISAGGGNTVSGNTVVNANREGIYALPGSTVRGNTVSGGADVGIAVRCPSNVIGNTATGTGAGLVLTGDGCTNIDNLAP
jgi:parallel beta-helix repeat protein